MKTTTTLFTVSFVSAVAAGWSQLDAVQEANGPDHKPALRKVVLDGNEISLDLDRDRVKAGGQVELSLAALKAGEVRVTVQEQSMMMDSRSEPPARTISSKIVDVGPEGAAVEAITLAGIVREEGADPLLTAGAATRYSILVGSDSDRGAVAQLPVFAYEPEAYRITVGDPTPGGVGEPCDVTVTVKNLTKKTLTGIYVSLSSTFFSTTEYPTIASLEAGDEITLTIHGTRIDTGLGAEYPMVLQAYGNAGYGGTSSAYAAIDRESGKVTERGAGMHAIWGAYAYGY